MENRKCEHCSEDYKPNVKWQKFCCQTCHSAARHIGRFEPKGRTCNWCKKTFKILHRGDNNRKFCSRKHFDLASKIYRAEYAAKNPEKEARWRQTRQSRLHRDHWKEKGAKMLDECLGIVGRECVVCKHSDPMHLQVDFIPGNSKAYFGYRHPRHPKFLRENRLLFQTLCADHHQEKTKTGSVRQSEYRNDAT